MVQLTITVSDRGEVSLSGPVDNMMLCYGMLAVAHDLVKEHADAKRTVIPATGDDLRSLKLHQ